MNNEQATQRQASWLRDRLNGTSEARASIVQLPVAQSETVAIASLPCQEVEAVYIAIEIEVSNSDQSKVVEIELSAARPVETHGLHAGFKCDGGGDGRPILPIPRIRHVECASFVDPIEFNKEGSAGIRRGDASGENIVGGFYGGDVDRVFQPFA